MKRFIAVAVAALLLLVTTSAAVAVSDIGNPNVSRLWVERPDGDKQICTVFFVRDLIDNSQGSDFSWVLSAGHCAIGNYIKRNADTTVLASVNWQVAYTSAAHGLSVVDYAIGSTPDSEFIRKADPNRGFWVAREMPDRGDAWVHGFPEGVERVAAVHILPRDVPLKSGVRFGSSRFVLIKKGEMAPGASGGPVINNEGRVIGIMWGVGNPEKILAVSIPSEFDLVIVMPIETVIKAFEELKRP